MPCDWLIWLSLKTTRCANMWPINSPCSNYGSSKCTADKILMLTTHLSREAVTLYQAVETKFLTSSYVHLQMKFSRKLRNWIKSPESLFQWRFLLYLQSECWEMCLSFWSASEAKGFKIVMFTLGSFSTLQWPTSVTLSSVLPTTWV